MRRAIVSLIAMSLCLLAAGCGSSSSSSTVSGALANELSYFPSGSPLVTVIETNPGGAAVQNLNGLLDQFPLAKLGIDELESTLESSGIDYQTDIEPLYGNPVTLAVLQVPDSVSVSGSDYLAVWVAKSAAKLDALIKTFPGLSPAGKLDGASLYRSSAGALAVDGATVFLAASAADIAAALKRHAHGGGLTAADFSKAMGTLPQNALIRAFGTLTSGLSTPFAASAHKIPWVAAIRGYGVAISAATTGLTAQFHVDTSGGPLTGDELPIASGETPPALAGTLPIAVGVRDPARSLDFIEAAARAADPESYAPFQRGEAAAQRKTGYDLNTFATLLTGNLIIESDTKTTMARVGVTDPASAAKQLAALPRVVGDIFDTSTGLSRLAGGFYAVKEGKGKAIDLGLVGNQFVAGVATPAQLRAFAAAPTTAAPGAQGAVAFRISLLELLKVALGSSPATSLVQSLFSTLGDLTGSASATTSALIGNLSLGVK